MKNKRVLVTGGAGFIGSHLVKRLVALGSDVSVLVKYKSINDCVRLSSVWDDIEVLEADLRNIDSLRQFKGEKYDIIFHLAAYNHVGDSFLHVNEALVSNILGTANLLEYAPEFDCFLYMSTSECYGYQNAVPFQEDNTPFPISPYAIGKYGGELYSLMKKNQKGGLPIVCVRAFNTFGPYQSEKAVIPELVIRCLRGHPIETTEGIQTREFNYIDNIIDGLLLAVGVEPFEGVINLGSNRAISIADLVERIHKIVQSDSELRIGALPYRPTEIWNMCADNDKALRYLKWSPKISLEDGLVKTVEWFKRYLAVFYDKNSFLNLL